MERPEGGALKSAATLALAALFFVLAIGSALLGSGVYRRVAAESAETSARRTALAYLGNQLRRADRQDGIQIGTFGGSDALYLYEGDYYTCIYCYGGALRELYTERGAELLPEDGVELLDLAGLTVAPESGTLTLTVSTGAGDASLSLTPRCGYEVTP